MKTVLLAFLALLPFPTAFALSLPPAAPVELRLSLTKPGSVVPEEFIGLSFEMQRVRPAADGTYFFRPDNKRLLTLFRTLGVKCLRVGGNTADRPTEPFPATKDIDQLFAFARKAGVKVIFTLRLREGDPVADARIARHIVDRYPDVIRAFAIGNEPNVFAPKFTEFLTIWKKFANTVNEPEFAPAARFAGPSSTAGKNSWTRKFAQEFAGTGRLLIATQHIYPGGNADLVRDPAEARRQMLSPQWVRGYQKFANGFVPGVLATGTPYRLGETNSFWNGGRKDVSNTFAAALWALDYQYWWAAHRANGLNFHTGDFVAKSEENTRCMYAVFWTTDRGYEAKPVAYAMKAFDLGGHGRIIPAEIRKNPRKVNLTAYATRVGDRLYATLINKGFGKDAPAAEVTLPAQPCASSKTIALVAPDGDVARVDGFTLGGETIQGNGTWKGRWSPGPEASADGLLAVRVPPASALVISFPAP